VTLRTVSPFKCRMWDMHDRMTDNIDTKSCASLIDSIQRHGQKHPVLARLPERSANCEYELIYGARRLFAAQHLGVDLLIEVRDLDDKRALIEMDVENRLRADISPYERGRSYQRWLSAGYFKSQTEMAKALAVSDSQVSRLLRYAELPAVVVGAFRSPNDIREEWAVALAKLCADPKSRALLTQRARSARVSEAETSPLAVYDILTNGRTSLARSPTRARDDVVRDARGRPLFRVRVKAKVVQIILPRDCVTLPTLQQIKEHIAQDMGAAPRLADSASLGPEERATCAELAVASASHPGQSFEVRAAPDARRPAGGACAAGRRLRAG
jgi:ParB family chromosome partitioning protein